MGFTNYPLSVEEINRRMEKELEYSQYLNKMFENNCRKQSVWRASMNKEITMATTGEILTIVIVFAVVCIIAVVFKEKDYDDD